MARSSTFNVSLTPTLDRYVREKVASGEFQSANDFIRESLRLARASENSNRSYWERVRRGVAVARREVEQGLAVDGEDAMDKIIAKLAKEPSRKSRKKSR